MTSDGGWGAEEDRRRYERALMTLVQDATVRIHRPPSGYAPEGPGDFLGSGFFIAPSWILTCAHVAMRGEGGAVNVVFRSDRYGGDRAEVPGRVVVALPGARPPGATGWPAPDLALVQLTRPVEHSCVHVTERSGGLLWGSDIRCVGWADAPGGELNLLSGAYRVRGAYGAADDVDQLVRLDEDWLVPGMSGGPVVDFARGEVVGVVKSQLDRQQGGIAVGIERLRTLKVPATPMEAETDDVYQAVFHAHDRYHADRHNSAAGTERTWADVQSELPVPPGGVLGPKRRADLLGRLAELAPPASTRSLLNLLDGLPGVHSRDHRPAPRGWRDGLGVLYDTEARDRTARFELIVRYCLGVLAADRPHGRLSVRNAKALWGWAKTIADVELPRDLRRRLDQEWADIRLGLEQNRQPAVPPPAAEPVRDGERDGVVLRIDQQGWARGRYDWRVSVGRHTGEAQPIDEDSRGVPLDTVPDRLAAALTEAFRRCDEPGSPAVLYAVVAPGQFGLPVDGWTLSPDGPSLGSVRPVVLSSSYRGPDGAGPDEGEPGPPPDTPGPGIRAEVVDCEDDVRVRVPEVAGLRALPPATVPVLCRYGSRPDAEATAGVVRLIDAGFAAALIQRRPAEADLVCRDFHRGVGRTVPEAGTRERLPWAVHELRRGVSAGRSELYWSDGIALYVRDTPHELPGADDPFLVAP
ncbi:trypsin-like peptidase domain-containing protein [Streptomyces sp. NPDC057682]|uniref:VMAP-C domain-containing protein n=1 Tax=Streptomyces sp. NPDC057682 TaxID=3346210 RepID=UPI0036BAB15D